MKAMPYFLAFSLAANLVLGWMLWQQHPVQRSEPSVAKSEAPEIYEVLPLPATSTPLTMSPFLPPVDSAFLPSPGSNAAKPFSLEPTSWNGSSEEKPYSPPLPPNPHAYPAWPERLPYRESQLDRALLTR